MSIIAPQLRQKFLNAGGTAALAGGKLYSYQAGTTTPLATYTDSTGATPNANPIILDANGECDLWLGSSAYKFILKTSADVQQWSVDNVTFPTVDNGFSTGDVKMSLKTVADSGWVLMNDTTIGNAASSATGRANADTLDLFTLLWNNTINTWCAVSTGRGASAAADFAANKTIALPKALGRALAIYGSGSGLTARAMAQYLGVETHPLVTGEMPSHTHTFTGDAHGHVMRATSNAGGSGNPATASLAVTGTAVYVSGFGNIVDMASTTANTTSTGTNSSTGSGTAHQNMQPTLFLNIMVKL